jgi:hypothetical protein
MVWLPSKIDAWWFYAVLLDLRSLQLGSAKPLVSSPFSFLFLVLVQWICATIYNPLWFPFFFFFRTMYPDHHPSDCSFGWLLVAGTDLFKEKSIIGWLLMVGLF